MRPVQEMIAEKEFRGSVKNLLIIFDLQPTDTNVEMMAVFLEALRVHDDRARRYADQWRQSGAVDNLRNARRKIVRQLGAIHNVGAPYDDDDTIDAINYCAFAVRNLRGLNLDGWEEDA